jgi:salicylate hydroxylase
MGDSIVAAFGAPYYHFHRADLLAALAAAVPAERLHTGKRCVGVDQSTDGATARFADGTSATADVVIGADGIHSAVRTAILGPEKPRFSGHVAYRGLAPAERLAHLELERLGTAWLGPGGHFVHYFVGAGRYVNFVAVTEEATWTRESWTDEGSLADAHAAFAGWHDQVHAIISAVDATYKWALHDREPLPTWTVGRVTLLGDACHAMLPYMAQGAVQSIEDGATLAMCLRSAGRARLPEALKRYEALRKPRVTRVQEMARGNAVGFHLPDGPEQQKRDAALTVTAEDPIKAFAGLYGHDAEAIDGVSGSAPLWNAWGSPDR